MNQDEILKMSRDENLDEWMERAENRGRVLEEIAFCCVFVVIKVFTLFHGGNNYGPLAMFLAFIAGGTASAASLLRFIIAEVW